MMWNSLVPAKRCLTLRFDTHFTPCRIDNAVSSFKAAVAAPHQVTCRSGGIGRRAWFRSMYPQGCGGSSPFCGTITFVIWHLEHGDTYTDTTSGRGSP